MTRLVLFLAVSVLLLINTSCDNAKIDNAETTVQVVSEKDCIPDAGCAGCPEAYARASIIPPKEIEEVLKQKPKVIFIELGSTHFVPSQKMQLIMASLKQKYGKQIQVIFYDVMKPDQQKYAEKYNIKTIPTQLFLDSNGKEIMRHEGFLPIDEIEAFLKEKGLKVEDIASR
jgi:thiol-disulfide isomerase/thioredoxin